MSGQPGAQSSDERGRQLDRVVVDVLAKRVQPRVVGRVAQLEEAPQVAADLGIESAFL